ncbi:MAG TPA: DUF4381 domain-containing protein [Xanthomonadales bacterium]|nr:DUF4381 domain-containing protein [Xanthomonadales bacterium]
MMQGPIPGNTELLAQLRDIHGVAEPGLWPPAPGWWLLAALAALGAFYLLRALARKAAARRRRRAWMQALEAVERAWDPGSQPHDYLAGLNRLFRAVALKAFPDARCGRLQGEEWVAFIRAMLPEGAGAPCLAALARGPYEPVPHFDATALREHARLWVKLYG